MRDKAIMMDRELSRAVQILIVAVLILLPASYLAFKYDGETRFSSLILFGERFDAQALDEVREIPRAYAGRDGYDGQFYAQVAIDPTLTHPQLADALDNPRYRSKRILVPVLAHLIGLRKAFPVLQAYALINMLFYLFLLGGMVHFLKPRTAKDFLCVAAVLWTTGCLVSLRRSLVDLPASTLIFYAATLRGAGAIPMLAAAVLARESSLLSALAPLWPKRWNKRDVVRRVAGVGVLIIPYVLWVIYVTSRFPPSVSGARLSVGLPLVGCFRHLADTLRALPGGSRVSLAFEILAPLSLLVQAAYMAGKTRLSSPYWRMGIGFAVLLIFLSAAVFHEQIAYTRAVLPMTIAFNVLLMKDEGKRFATWFLAGNTGLAWCALHMVGEMLGAF